ncbi:hypothetical protein CCH79_00020014, partial [Gambusia affinis]
TLALTRISSDDEAIYQCIAENSAGTNQASARLAVAQAKDLPAAPQGLMASALTINSLQMTWSPPPISIADSIIGYVLHIRKLGEPDHMELQEAISKDTFQHDVTNLEPGTTYSLYLKAYSSLGASQQSNSVIKTTLGSVPAPPICFTKVLNSTTVQVFWELPAKPGKVEGFKLTFRRIPLTDYHEPIELPFHACAHTISNLEPRAVYEIKLVAYNGNGESDSSKRLVSLAGQGISDQINSGNRLCECRDAEASLGSVVIGIHIGTACIIFCVLFLIFGYHRSLFCSEGTQVNWPIPRFHGGQNIPKGGTHYPHMESEAQMVCPPRCQVIIEQNPTDAMATSLRYKTVARLALAAAVGGWCGERLPSSPRLLIRSLPGRLCHHFWTNERSYCLQRRDESLSRPNQRVSAACRCRGLVVRIRCNASGGPDREPGDGTQGGETTHR